MKIILYGASGMVGQGVLRECLNDQGVTQVLAVGRMAVNIPHPKLRDLVLMDFLNYSAAEQELAGYDACFFCLGSTAAGRTEAQYAAINHDIPVAAGTALAKINPGMTFIYVSGAGTDSTAKGRIVWARIKGQTENDLLRLPLKTYVFRPAAIQPMHGEVSKTLGYRVFIAVLRPVFPLMRTLLPAFATSTENMGRAMLKVARGGYSTRILESRDINRVAETGSLRRTQAN